jgi:hypothetical protein
VRLHERVCPFCADDIPERAAPPIVTTAQTSRLSRSARIALGAALAAALPACGGATPEPAPAPGPAPTSTTAQPGEPTNPPDDDGAPVAEYGAPAPPDDDGAGAAEYGAPPHPDEGGMAPKYGGPPAH